MPVFIEQECEVDLQLPLSSVDRTLDDAVLLSRVVRLFGCEN
jgi:hypothetical protein